MSSDINIGALALFQLAFAWYVFSMFTFNCVLICLDFLFFVLSKWLDFILNSAARLKWTVEQSVYVDSGY